MLGTGGAFLRVWARFSGYNRFRKALEIRCKMQSPLRSAVIVLDDTVGCGGVSFATHTEEGTSPAPDIVSQDNGTKPDLRHYFHTFAELMIKRTPPKSEPVLHEMFWRGRLYSVFLALDEELDRHEGQL